MAPTGPDAQVRPPDRGPVVAVAALAAAVLVVTSVLASGDAVGGAELAAFEALNGAPALLSTLLWPAVQLGSILLLPALALAATALADGRRGGAVALAGALAWLGAEGLKQVVARPRPAALLDEVVVRGGHSAGFGFPSGHTAVAAAVAVALAPLLPDGRRWLAALLPVLVGTGRIAAGAHLPLDVIGGAAVGVLAGLAARQIVDRMGPAA